MKLNVINNHYAEMCLDKVYKKHPEGIAYSIYLWQTQLFLHFRYLLFNLSLMCDESHYWKLEGNLIM